MFDLVMSFFALLILEVVLGIDNLVFLSLLTSRLPMKERQKARYWGLTLAWLSRLLLLAAAMCMVQLTTPLFSVDGHPVSLRDVFLLLGGSFLIAKATEEIHHEVDVDDTQVSRTAEICVRSFRWILAQIVMMDLVFSLDSVLTAVGLTQHFSVMAAAITVSIGVMLYASEWVSLFLERYPALKMLALSFLMLIGVVLIADGFGLHIPRAYVYFAMGFSLSVEGLNTLKKRKGKK